jgi:hypothetical protein
MATKLSFEEWKNRHPGINLNDTKVCIHLEEVHKLPAQVAADKILRERYEEYIKAKE